jgi:hypothetical protein
MTHSVNVTVTTPAGTSATTSAAQFTYIPPTVTAVSPARGPLAGGTSVTITGSGFTGATAVSFGPTPASSFTVNSDTQITATSPAAPSRGPVHVTVTFQAVTSATSNADQFTYPLGVLFHQNMRVYGGAAGGRNTAYSQAFAAISAHLNPVLPSVLIAGFTELTNNRSAVAGLNNGLCAALGVGQAQAVCTRQTALQTQPMDFTAIAVAQGVNILSWGRVVLSASGGGVNPVSDVWNPQVINFATWAANVPGNQALDYQSLVYVVADIGGPIVAVAFLHNIYQINDNVGLALQKLPDAADLIAQNPQMPRDAAGQPAGVIYVCGDFNALPLLRQNHAGIIAQPFSQPSLLPGTAPPEWSPNAILTQTQTQQGYKPGGTTAAGNLYDYSFSSVIGNPPLRQLEPAIDVVTLDTPRGNNLMSDHTAALLNII